jgi:hypothetical protein
MFGKVRAFVIRVWYRLRGFPPVDVIINERFTKPTKAQVKRVKRRLEQQRLGKRKVRQ